MIGNGHLSEKNSQIEDFVNTLPIKLSEKVLNNHFDLKFFEKLKSSCFKKEHFTIKIRVTLKTLLQQHCHKKVSSRMKVNDKNIRKKFSTLTHAFRFHFQVLFSLRLFENGQKILIILLNSILLFECHEN